MSAKVIQVIEVWTTRGKGTEADPCRTVREYWSFEGERLAEFDPCADDIRYRAVPDTERQS